MEEEEQEQPRPAQRKLAKLRLWLQHSHQNDARCNIHMFYMIGPKPSHERDLVIARIGKPKTTAMKIPHYANQILACRHVSENRNPRAYLDPQSM